MDKVFSDRDGHPRPVHREQDRPPKTSARQEQILLRVLQDAAGQPVSVTELLDAAQVRSLASLRVHMSHIRTTLGDQAHRLRTVRGFGYRWGEPVMPAFPGGCGAVLDVDNRAVMAAGLVIELSTHHAQILRVLTERPGTAVDVPTLLQSTDVSTRRSLVTHVSELRRTLAPLEALWSGESIRYRRGLGYLYCGPPLQHVSDGPRQQTRVELDTGDTVRIGGRALRLRTAEKSVLRTLADREGEPVTYTELIGLPGVGTLTQVRSAVTVLRSLLRPSGSSIVHCGHRSQAYVFRRSRNGTDSTERRNYQQGQGR